MPTPLVTLTPASLDTSLVNKNAFPNSSQAGFGCGISAGPWFITGANGGDAWYTIACAQTGQDVPQIYKSTNGRLTWTKVAQAASTINLWNVYYPGTGTTLYMVITDTGDAGKPPRIQTFNFATDTFGTASSAHPSITFSGQTTGVQLVLQSGTFFLFYDRAFNTSISYTTQTAGTWAGATVLHVGTLGNQTPAALVMEAGGRFHLWWNDTTATTNDWWYCQFSSLGIAGTPAKVYSGNTAISFNQIANGTHLAQVVGNTIIFPFAQVDGTGDFLQKACVLIGTGLSAPVWTFAWVDPTGAALPAALGGDDYAERDALAVLGISGILYVFFSVYFPSGSGTGIKQQIWYAPFDGVSTFGTLVLFFDSGVVPFPNQTNTSGTVMYALSGTPTQKADGTWTLMVGTNFNSPAIFNLLNYVIYTGVLGITSPGTGYVFEYETGVGRRATWEE